MQYSDRTLSASEQLNLDKEMCESVIAEKDAVLRLLENKDFLKVIDKGFMEANVIRNADMAKDPNVSESIQRNCESAMLAPGHLKRFLHAIVIQGNNAQVQLERINEEINELLEQPIDDNEGEE